MFFRVVVNKKLSSRPNPNAIDDALILNQPAVRDFHFHTWTIHERITHFFFTRISLLVDDRPYVFYNELTVSKKNQINYLFPLNLFMKRTRKFLVFIYITREHFFFEYKLYFIV